MSDNAVSLNLPAVTRVKVNDAEGNCILDEELIHVNALVHAAMAGVDVKDSFTWPVYSERLAALLNEKYKLSLSASQAWAIGERVVEALRELKAGFTKGRP